jgi:zinc and cadmium transporter
MNAPLSSFMLVVLYSLLVLIAALAGGWLPTLFRLTHTRLQVGVSFVAGLMLGLSVLHLLPHGIEELHSPDRGVRWLLAGFLVMFFLQRFLPFHHHDVPAGQPANDLTGLHATGHSTHLDWVGVAVGLSLHSVVDGLALAAAVMAGRDGHGGALGIGTALAVILHKPFGALAITTLMSASGTSRRWLHLVNAAFALVTPVGALLFFMGAGPLVHAHPAWLGMALTFCAGTFLCIACADLLPELQFHSHDRLKLSAALLAGVAVAVAIGQFGHAHPPHSHAGCESQSLVCEGRSRIAGEQFVPERRPIIAQRFNAGYLVINVLSPEMDL